MYSASAKQSSKKKPVEEKEDAFNEMIRVLATGQMQFMQAQAAGQAVTYQVIADLAKIMVAVQDVKVIRSPTDVNVMSKFWSLLILL